MSLQLSCQFNESIVFVHKTSFADLTVFSLFHYCAVQKECNIRWAGRRKNTCLYPIHSKQCRMPWMSAIVFTLSRQILHLDKHVKTHVNFI